MTTKGGENIAAIRTKDGDFRHLGRMRDVGKQMVDHSCTEAIGRGWTVRGVAVVLVARDERGVDRPLFDARHEDSFSMAYALDAAATKMKLDMWLPQEGDE